jgi:hypothetical protein
MSAQIIAALCRRAEVLETDAALYGHDPAVAVRYADSVAMTVTPSLIRFAAAEFRKLAETIEELESP